MALKVLVAAAVAGGLVYIHRGPELGRRVPDATVLDVKPIVVSQYVGEVDERALERAAVRAMVEALGDPHSSFMPPDEAEAFYEQTDSEFGGLGIEITVREGLVHVIAPIEDTPAFHAGILPGDVIVEVDGERCDFRTSDEAARHLKGEPGSTVQLKVLHYGGTEELAMAIQRALIRVKSVRRPTLEDPANGLGYVRITSFTKTTGEELRDAIAELERAGPLRGLVLDLRRNPGGYLRSALEVADLFLEDGTILETRGRQKDAVKVHAASPPGTLPRRPLAVLVNGASASAAEIVAGALKDGGLARVFGTRTYGKGSVQQVVRLRDGSALRLTTEHFYTRSGKRIHRPEGAGPDEEWGIAPDVVVELDAVDLQRILMRRSAEAFRTNGPGGANGNGAGGANGNGAGRAGGEAEPVGPRGAAPGAPADGEPLVDRQLEAALEWLREEAAR